MMNKEEVRDQTAPLFKKLGLLKIYDIHRQQTWFLCTYSIKNYMQIIFSSYFSETTTVH